MSLERGVGDLRRALYAYTMNLHKDRVKAETKARQAAAVLSACEALVEASLKEAFVAGFTASGEGWNGEHGLAEGDLDRAYADWRAERDG